MPRKPLFVHDYLLCKGVKDRYVWHSHSGARQPPTPAHPVITAARKRILINELIITLVNNIVLFWWNHSIAAQTHTESFFFLFFFHSCTGCEFLLFLILPTKMTFIRNNVWSHEHFLVKRSQSCCCFAKLWRRLCRADPNSLWSLMIFSPKEMSRHTLHVCSLLPWNNFFLNFE